MTTYRGVRRKSGAHVTADGERLDARLDLRNLSLTFEWGYVGSGPYQLSLAVLAHERGPEDALDLYRDFAEVVIAELNDDEWTLESDDITRAIENLEPVPMDLQELLRRVRGER